MEPNSNNSYLGNFMLSLTKNPMYNLKWLKAYFFSCKMEAMWINIVGVYGRIIPQNAR